MVAYREIISALRSLELDPGWPVIAHASLSAFGEVRGGASFLLGALLGTVNTLVMPTFTYRTMVTPEVGPPNNGLEYGSGQYSNQTAMIFQRNMPADRLMGTIPETLRRHPQAQRSLHPILSFSGINAIPYLKAQTYAEPLAPIRKLVEAGGWVLLLGVDHTTNTSIHYGELLAGRKRFVRWALTLHGIRECPAFPGCSAGFQTIAPHLEPVTRSVKIGSALVQAVPVGDVVETARSMVVGDPLALLCERSYCERCTDLKQAAGEKV